MEGVKKESRMDAVEEGDAENERRNEKVLADALLRGREARSMKRGREWSGVEMCEKVDPPLVSFFASNKQRLCDSTVGPGTL